MTIKRRHEHGEDVRGSGITGFVRSLLSGIPWSESAHAEEVLHFDKPTGGILRLHNANGRTSVCGEDRSDIEVELRKAARAESSDAAEKMLAQIHLASEENGDALELELEAPSRWNRRGCANIEIRCPRDLAVEISAVNGRIEIDGLRNRVRARSSNGSACIDDVVGDIDVATSNAKVCCTCTCGKLVARSSNGKIEIDKHRGSVDASTSNGLIRASLDAVGKQGITLATSNGRIVLELPDQVDADVDVRIDNGVIRNDRTLEHADRDTNGRLRGRLGAGGAPIKLRTSNGSISLR